jgi:RNA polymerase sigma factor (sigma-70 family)
MAENYSMPASTRQDPTTRDTAVDETTPAVHVTGEQWVILLKNYDEQAWSFLMSYYSADLRRDIAQSLRKRGLSPDCVDDIEQETWLTAVEQIADFVWHNEEKLYNWLRKISYQHVRTLRRKTKENEVSLQSVNDRVETALSLDIFMYVHGLIEDSPENDVLLRESLKALDTALRYLKPREREIVLRRLLYRETPRAMAADYNLKPETISVILTRSKHAIRAQMSALGFFQEGN